MSAETPAPRDRRTEQQSSSGRHPNATPGQPSLLGIALENAGRGWAVFPLEPLGKRPLGRLAPRGLHDATCDIDRIQAWWRAEPRANVAVATGAVSGLVVLDVDGLDGWRALCAIQDQHPTVLAPYQVDTPRPEGAHRYFVHPGHNVANSAGRLGPGLDVRGDGGYVVGAGSRRPGGAWVAVLRWEDCPRVVLPPWLEAKPETPSWKPQPPRLVSGRGYGGAALRSEAQRVRAAVPGSRNATLNGSAFALGQLVGAGLLDRSEAAWALADAAQGCGLGEAEAVRTIRSGLAAGEASPRAVAS